MTKTLGTTFMLFSLNLSTLLGLSGCQSVKDYPPLRTESYVDLQRFAGSWYVIANIPTPLETDAYGAIEHYALPDDGVIETTFTYYDGGFDGEKKVYEPTGFVRDTQSNAVWGMQFIWPFKAEYRIMYVDEDYEITVIGRSKRDYVWIMSRHAVIGEDTFQSLLKMIKTEGYDISKVQKVPQRENHPDFQG